LMLVAASWSPLFEPGFFGSEPVHVALVVGAIAAIVSGIVGVFTVIRGQSFAGHALADIGTAGGSAAFLVGASTLYGFVAFNVVAAAVMELLGLRKPRGRDLATGIVLGASLGLAALFLYEGTISSSTTGATVNVLFGSIFTLPPGTTPVMAILGVASLLLIAVLYRPLLLSSVSDELAAARRVPVRLVGGGYLLALALAVSMSAVTIGAILSTALLIGPAAIALRVVYRTGAAFAVAVAVGVFACWAGTLVAYDSTVWAGGHGWPVSFCIVAVIFVLYFASAMVSRFRTDRRLIPPRGPAALVESLEAD
jgi:zinc/manganese transport system permease protein